MIVGTRDVDLVAVAAAVVDLASVAVEEIVLLVIVLMDVAAATGRHACCRCHARQEHNRHKVFPVPVGLSNNAFSLLFKASITFSMYRS
jgi:hypothetical protein